MSRVFLSVFAILLSAHGLTLAADEPASFESILSAEQRRTFERIAEYVSDHPDVADAFAAR